MYKMVDYKCSDCGHIWEDMLDHQDGEQVEYPKRCPKCLSRIVQRVLGNGKGKQVIIH